MKKLNPIIAILSGAILATASGCRDEVSMHRSDESALKINLAGEINQVSMTRVNDSGFADGDEIGVYVVNYDGITPGTLQSAGNHADNVSHVFDAESGKWVPASELNWKDGHTAIDIYGYYPKANPDDVNSYAFTIQTNQNTSGENGKPGGFEASDFLWGKSSGIEPTDRVISLSMNHVMASVRITLTEGEGFSEGEWNDINKQVIVSNTIPEATINLASGEVAVMAGSASKSITPAYGNGEWRAIAVPQTVKSGMPLFNIEINGIPYVFTKNEDFIYSPGKLSSFNIRVDKKSNSGKYELTLIGESITAWETDPFSHDATTKEYLVINVETPGTLADCIKASGMELSKVKNLKITGKINSCDFGTIKNEMDNIEALNLKEVEIAKSQRHSASDHDPDDDTFETHYECEDNEIPVEALHEKKSLRSLVLPDKLKGIGFAAFYHCEKLSGSLVIPEGTEYISESAFGACNSLNGTLSLPTTLKTLGGSAFGECSFSCELRLPDGITEIGDAAFYNCNSFYGELHLPDNLKKLGSSAFQGCTNLKGSLKIPKGVTEIAESCFEGSGFDGNLYLHDDVTYIGARAFFSCIFRGELLLPKNLTSIGEYAFYNTGFTGELKFPDKVSSIGFRTFYGTSFSGTLSFGKNIENIGEAAFFGCSFIEKLEFEENVRSISREAFANCFGIGSIVCKGETPPQLLEGGFSGVPKDNFVLNVPESAIEKYKTASGWSDFKRISAHHELVCRPSVACALSTEHKQTLVVDAEGEWEVASKPDWCELSQNSGDKKTEITLTIKASDASSGSRDGDITFRLKDKDYTSLCHVTQYGYQYAEDEYLTLQQATRGNTGGINIVILGDGYDAKDIASGQYLADMKQQMEYFFGIEPYATYRDYFNVYTAFPLSTESGVGTLNTIRYTRFSTTFTGREGLKCDNEEVFSYAMNAPTVNSDNLDSSLIIIVPNSTSYGGGTHLWESGAAISICPKSDFGYPYDARGVIQHEAAGVGFGKLGNEAIYENSFVCKPCIDDITKAKSLGWYDNLELTGKMNQVGWSHLIFDSRYSDIVDIFEGGHEHTRGVFRSEENSCMNNYIPYFSTISRESIVKRIKRYAGETFSFEEFVANDKRTAGSTRSSDMSAGNSRRIGQGTVIHNGKPAIKHKTTRK